jgi:SAM-dependent methyltransferase
MTLAARMQREWDDRAARDAQFYIASGTADAEAFWRSGEEELSALILSEVELAPSAEVLEIGCGIGRLMRPLAAKARHVLGVDISPSMIAEARHACGSLQNVDFAVTDGALRDVRGESRDFIFSYIVFQHIPEVGAIDEYVRDVARVLRPGGVFHFQVDSRTGRRGTYTPDTYAGVTLESREVREMADAAGLEVVQQWGAGTHYLWTTCRKPGRDLDAIRIVPRIVDWLEVADLNKRLSRVCDEGMSVDIVELRPSIDRFVVKYAARPVDEFVGKTFQVLLAREALERESEFAAGIVARGLESPSDWIDTIATSSELHDRLLPRIPSIAPEAEERLRQRVPELSEGTIGTIMLQLSARAVGVPHDDAVELLYQFVLGRKPDPEGRAYFVRKLELGHFTRVRVISELLLSDELRTGIMPVPKPLETFES